MGLSVNVLSPLVLFIVTTPTHLGNFLTLFHWCPSPLFCRTPIMWLLEVDFLSSSFNFIFIFSFLSLQFFMGNFTNSYLVLYFCYNIFNFQNLSVAFCSILSTFFSFWFHSFFLFLFRCYYCFFLPSFFTFFFLHTECFSKVALFVLCVGYYFSL